MTRPLQYLATDCCKVAVAFSLVAGCSDGSQQRAARTDAVLYTIGLSTDPYGQSAPRGFGIATGLSRGRLEKVEIRDRRLGGFGGADWIDAERILVPQDAPPLRLPLVFRLAEGKLSRDQPAPIQATSSFARSPDGKLIAFEPARPCAKGQRSLFDCYRSSGRIFVVRDDGTGRRRVAAGHLAGWTADGRVAFTQSDRQATLRALDLDSGRARSIVPGWKLELPIWSRNGRYLAARTRTGLLIADARGRTVRTVRSRLTISMIAWAPVGERLAYTTSGFPDPHQVFVLDRPRAVPRRLYDAGPAHFDWITWSPDGMRLLLDDYGRGRWLLLPASGEGERRALPELGGRPLWCCPVNAFSSLGSRRQ